ncbi:polyhydroxyalkanoate synthase [Tranquillimonas rosea]|uniref:Polyhydroxyalkanoate synthase n=1 Tax=Tranquillimonas rosea TaxID=641238 RepID=A0A1H9WCM9_9RHOB|nr:class I poly(R)-hydroxyalkanoic acid synthase [Tranquillimonas rosea]SES31660.1 polyhydroxyalkanoate synthase [Tranquillimonas rosea]
MTTEESDGPAIAPNDLETLNQNLARVEELSERLVAALAHKRHVRPALQGPGNEVFMKAATAYTAEMIANPSKIFEHQVAYWSKAMRHYLEAQHTLAQGRIAPPSDHGPSDKRFSNPLWDTNPYFNYIKQQYLFSAEAITNAVEDLDGLPERERRRIAYFSRQIVDLMSPTNFLPTNPDALAKAVETDGQSLVDGLENLVRDIEAGEGEILVTLADREAFKVGENLATTEGSVVYRNKLFELIQYSPETETQHKTPLLIFPPWINKFYILDLKPKNSLIRHIVEQGYTLFVVSWRNPDRSFAEIGLGDYIEQGYLDAISKVKEITGEDQVNAVGYCIAGTALSLTLALMHKRGDKSIKSATFFTTLTDFTDQGEFSVFLDNDFVDGIEAEVHEKGVLDSFFMSRTFSFLRANDLIYQPAIKSYMMGESPPAFDLLFWNGDSTNLPARMTLEYLRRLCQQNAFAEEGIELLGERLHIRDVRVPLLAVACETDHIANWANSYHGIQKMGSRSKTFVLSESGHIAGIVNPPSKKKYGHYTNGDWSGTPEDWRVAADFHEGSWWPFWLDWLKKRSGRQVDARVPGEGDVEILAPAPGTYVVEEPEI